MTHPPPRWIGGAVLAMLSFAIFAHFASATSYDSYKAVAVTAAGKKYAIDLVTINLGNPKLHVYTLTGTNGTSCYEQPCATRSLKSYNDELKGFAAINGTYFCPADYAQCRGKAGNYYWMVFNARKSIYVNRTQNRFNHGPLFTLDSQNIWRFYPETWKFFDLNGVDKNHIPEGITAAISMGPLLVRDGGYYVNPATLDYKSRSMKMNRSAIGFRGTTISLVVAHGATVPDMGRVMQSLHVTYALNLDGGGSSALYYRGKYHTGPGRNLPNAIIFAEK